MLFRLSWIALILFCSTPAYADFDVFGAGGNQFQIEFVTVGDPGNSPNPNQLDLGQVNYEYRIAKFEISRDMISKANTAGALGLAMADMSSLGGNGNNRPATGLSWNEAARFVNWLNTSSGFAAAYKFNNQPGDAGYNTNDDLVLWTTSDVGFNSANPYRNSLAKYFLPSIDEWHKAAYHDPTITGTPDTYWEYATRSNDIPSAVGFGNNPNANEAVYSQLATQGPADIDNAGGLSYWGTMGQGGNVFEWNESATPFPFFNPPSIAPDTPRIVRGGSWVTASDADLLANVTYQLKPDFSDINPFSPTISEIGFRIASTSSTAVPEPSSWLLVSVSAVGGWIYKRRRARAKQQPHPCQAV
jgi:hypothetical protein